MEHIPSLRWLDKHLPDHIDHKHMEDVKMKTNKVGIDRKKMCSYQLATILQVLIHSLFMHLSPERVKRATRGGNERFTGVGSQICS